MKYLIFILALVSGQANGTEFKSEWRGGNYVVVAENLPLPEDTFKKQIKSGLTTTMVARLIVKAVGKPAEVEVQSFLIYFDLWDECYIIKHIHEQSIAKSEEKNPDVVVRTVRNLRFNLKPQVKDQSIEVSLRLTLNPISAEKVRKIRKWLAENNVNLPSAGSSVAAPELGSSKGVTASQAAISPLSGARFSGVLAQVLNSELADSTTGSWVYNSPLVTLTLKGAP